MVFYFGVPKHLVMDTEKSFNSQSIKSMLEQPGKEICTAPSYCYGTVNLQIERFHSTLSEIKRCLKKEAAHRDFKELLD